MIYKIEGRFVRQPSGLPSLVQERMQDRMKTLSQESIVTSPKQLINEAHENCRYSKATRGNIDVAINLIERAPWHTRST